MHILHWPCQTPGVFETPGVFDRHSASRYRQVEQDETYYEKPEVTMERLLTLEQIMELTVQEIQELLE